MSEDELARLEGEIAMFRADYERVVGPVVAEYRAVLQEIAARGGDVPQVAQEPPPAPPAEDLKPLFRRAAKAMHPDLARDDDARRHAEAFTRRLTSAYRVGDAEAIADLLRQWERGGPAPGSSEALRESEFGVMLEEAMAAQLRGEDYLQQLRDRWTVALADARARLDALTP